MRPILLSFLFTAVAPLLAQDPTDAQHYKLEIELNFATKQVAGKNTATFLSKQTGLAALTLDLASSLAVSAVQMNSAGVPFTRSGNQVQITLDRAYNLNEQFTVEVAYAGTPASGGFGGFSFTTHGSAASPMAWTLSEPWYSYTWWPVKETLTDKSTSEVWITHPDTMTAASNGARQGIDTLSGNRLRTRWKNSYQIAPYLICLAVTNYQTRTDTYTGFGANMPVEFYVFPESFASWQTGMNLVVPMLNAFSTVYGQYPFVGEKYGIAQFTWGGGMEHQTITFQSGVSEYLNAHELSHHWWGDDVTCASWHDIWLNEGFATFSEAIWAENKPGGSLAAYLTKIRQTKPGTTTGTVYVYDTSNINNVFSTTNVYNKGSWVCHQLRHVLGDASFFKALADYRAAFSGRSATTAEFRAACEQSSGRDLGWFFDEWVMKGGAPSYVYAARTASQGGQHYLYLQIDQTQTTQSVFTMPLDVRVTTGAGTVTPSGWNDERNDQIALPIPAPASAWVLDPDQWVLRGATTTRAYAPPFFAVEPETLDTVLGGASRLHMDLGVTNAQRPYLILVGMSGSTPGIMLGSLKIPLNFDALTALGLDAVNSSVFASFMGQLDAQGLGLGTFQLPAGIGAPLKGYTLTFSHLLIDAFDFASRPVSVRLR